MLVSGSSPWLFLIEQRPLLLNIYLPVMSAMVRSCLWLSTLDAMASLPGSVTALGNRLSPSSISVQLKAADSSRAIVTRYLFACYLLSL